MKICQPDKRKDEMAYETLLDIRVNQPHILISSSGFMNFHEIGSMYSFQGRNNGSFMA